MSKVDIEPKILKLKTQLFEGKYKGASQQWIDGAHYQLNLVLNILQEYSS